MPKPICSQTAFPTLDGMSHHFAECNSEFALATSEKWSDELSEDWLFKISSREGRGGTGVITAHFQDNQTFLL